MCSGRRIAWVRLVSMVCLDGWKWGDLVKALFVDFDDACWPGKKSF